MIDDIFRQMPNSFVTACAPKTTSYYFSMGDCKKTVVLSATECVVTDGRAVDNADCVCKTSPEFFCKIWDEGYKPSMKDFLSGTIKSNDPDSLRLFLKCFGKDL